MDKFDKPLCREHQQEFKNKKLKEAKPETVSEKTEKSTSSKTGKVIVKEMWQDYDNPNYYILKLGT